MPQIVIAVAAAIAAWAAGPALGFAAGSLGASIVGALAATAVSALGNLIFFHPDTKAPGQTVRQPLATHKIVAGQVRAGGALTFVDTNGGTAADETDSNKYLDIVVTLSGHALALTSTYYLNNTLVPVDSTGAALTPPDNPDGTTPVSYRKYIRFWPGNGTNAGDASMLAALQANSAFWAPTALQGGRGKLFAKLAWNADAYGSTGIPNITTMCFGRSVYDPRVAGVAITTSSGSPGTFNTVAAHGLAAGNMVWILNHAGAVPVAQTTWPSTQQAGVVQGYEVNSVPTSTSFTLVGPDGLPLGLSVGGSGGTVNKLLWTDNAELVTNDYLCDPYYGIKAVYTTEIPEPQLIAGANVCDEFVARAAPSTTFVADPSTDIITWVPGQNAGDIPQFARVVVSTTGTLPPPLAADTVYFYSGKLGPAGYLCTTLENAMHNPPVGINITGAGTGTQTITIADTFAVNQVQPHGDSLAPQPIVWPNILTLYSGALRILTGDQVQVSTLLAGGTLPTPLTAGTTYYAVHYDARLVGLAVSLADARAGNLIAITDSGSQTDPMTYYNYRIKVIAEPRYRADGLIDTSTPRQQVVQELLTAMGGYLVPAGVSLGLFPAAYITPTVTINCDVSPSDLRGPVQLQTLESGQSSFNGTKGVYIDPFSQWQPTDMQWYQNAGYLAADAGEVVWKELRFPYTLSNTTAQRLQKIELERIRREILTTLKGMFSLFQISPPDVVMVNFLRYGWSAKTFEVRVWNLTRDDDHEDKPPALGIDLTVRETDAAVFAWTAAEELAAKIAPKTNLPNPFVVAPPTNLSINTGDEVVFVQTDGTVVVQVELDWTAPADPFVSSGGAIELWFVLSGSTGWQMFNRVAGDVTLGYIGNLQSGEMYDFALRSRNTIGGYSDQVGAWPWQCQISGFLVQGKGLAPADVPNLSVVQNGNVVVLSGDPIADTDVACFEYRYGTVRDWNAMTLIEAPIARPNVGGFAGSCTSGSIPNGTWWFAVKAKDTTGNYSIDATYIQATIDAAGVILLDKIAGAPAWVPQSGGTSTGFLIHYTGVLVPNQTTTAGSQSDADLWDTFSAAPVSNPIYEGATIDLGADTTVIIYPQDLGAYAGQGVVGVPIVIMEIDTWTSAGSDSGTWTTISGPVTQTIRHIRWRIREDTSVPSCITAATIEADVQPAAAQSGIHTAAAGGTAIVFPTPFHTTPSITITASGANVGWYTGASNTGFTMHIGPDTTHDNGGSGSWQASGT